MVSHISPHWFNFFTTFHLSHTFHPPLRINSGNRAPTFIFLTRKLVTQNTLIPLWHGSLSSYSAWTTISLRQRVPFVFRRRHSAAHVTSMNQKSCNGSFIYNCNLYIINSTGELVVVIPAVLETTFIPFTSINQSIKLYFLFLFSAFHAKLQCKVLNRKYKQGNVK